MKNQLSLKSAFVAGMLMFAWTTIGAQAHATERHALAGERLQNTLQSKSGTSVKKTYVCPMHPEVKSSKRGKCPKCKMDLRLEKPATDGQAAAGHSGSHDNGATQSVPLAVDSVNVNTSINAYSSGKKMDIPDVEVLDQHGNELHFYRDLIKGKTVAINFIFTNCTTICPPLAATFARVQKELGDKVGRDVHFISISVDPVTDTPERLKAWGAKFKAGNGWTFVTGTKPEMDKLLSALGAAASRREDHTPAVIIGNDTKGIWTRTYGLAKTAQMVGLILDVMEGKADDSQTKETTKP